MPCLFYVDENVGMCCANNFVVSITTFLYRVELAVREWVVCVIDVVADARARAKRISGLHKEESLRIVDFLVELAEFDRLKRYEALGYARLSHWLADELHLERTQIYYRTSAARIIQCAPIAL